MMGALTPLEEHNLNLEEGSILKDVTRSVMFNLLASIRGIKLVYQDLAYIPSKQIFFKFCLYICK